MKYAALVSMLFLVGCASTSELTGPSDTMRIIEAAAEAAPNGVRGEFEFYIQASGSQGGVVYLNTELDYRDRRSISVAIDPRLARYYQSEFGQSPEEFFKNKTIKVTGEAKQVQIFFTTDDGFLSDKYYFQTHVNVSRANQIEVVGLDTSG